MPIGTLNVKVSATNDGALSYRISWAPKKDPGGSASKRCPNVADATEALRRLGVSSELIAIALEPPVIGGRRDTHIEGHAVADSRLEEAGLTPDAEPATA